MEFKDIEQTPYTAPTQIPHAAVHAGIDALEMTLTHGATPHPPRCRRTGMRLSDRAYKLLHEKPPVTYATVSRAIEMLGNIIAENEEWAETLLPIYLRLEQELEKLSSTRTKLDEIRARASAAKQSTGRMAA